MTDELTSPSLKSGNVLALLNTLYTSGFAMASSSTPLLKGKTLHTLYAVSFVVYVTNSICSWLHISFVVKGYVTSFPLNTWLVISLVVTAVCGSMCTWLLLVLCIENAFAHRLDITPYRSGCALLFEAFMEWTQAFNNFRMSFLIMALHDAPITIFNYFFIAACRCPNPKILSWPLVLSASSCTVSLIWRITVLYFSYKRMVCSKKPVKKVSGVAVNTPAKKHFRQATDTSSKSNGGRLGEYDETWPIRWARIQTIGPHHDRLVDSSDATSPISNGKPRSIPSPVEKPKPVMKDFMRRAGDFRANFDCQSSCRYFFGHLFWCILTFITYLVWTALCWIPCVYHYTCRHNSFYHRHKFCRSFIRYFSITFHYSIFYLSLVISAMLIGMNVTLLSSVHGLGSNSMPPEIDRICVTISPESHMIYTSILPASPFETSLQLRKRLNRQNAPKDPKAVTECKPLWEDGGLGIGLARREAGVWEMRTPINNTMLAVSTYVTFNNTKIHSPSLRLEYTHTLFIRRNNNVNEKYTCVRESGWTVVPSVTQLKWPYFSACEQNWKFAENPNLIECNQIFGIGGAKKHNQRHNFHFLRTYAAIRKA
ncbi:hypothetical protein L5515_018052 [Caenorhabditis briggsae]|uniref:Uncharacterized protein n=1 Tax=Caenorhabditis briggsae TaxID=6238 RepID=A0AAE9FEV7_CAEBR|nr:hypothetical protein L5515_018052 [Caenorhabditis briggsae]